MMKHGVCSLIAALLVSSATALAGDAPAAKSTAGAADDAKMEALREKLKTDKRYLVSENMGLTDAEAKAFWPLYDSYQKDLEKVNGRLADIVNQYLGASAQGPLPEGLSKKLVADSLDLEKQELELKKAHLARVAKALPAPKLVRYAQIENKIRALVKYELAINIPMAE
jgi:hypothetical protein